MFLLVYSSLSIKHGLLVMHFYMLKMLSKSSYTECSQFHRKKTPRQYNYSAFVKTFWGLSGQLCAKTFCWPGLVQELQNVANSPILKVLVEAIYQGKVSCFTFLRLLSCFWNWKLFLCTNFPSFDTSLLKFPIWKSL